MPTDDTQIVVVHGDRSAIVLQDPSLVAAVVRMAHEHLAPHEVAALDRTLTSPRLHVDGMHRTRTVEVWFGGRHEGTGGERIFKSQHAELVDELILLIEEGRENDAPAPRNRRNVYLVQRGPHESLRARSQRLPATTQPQAVLAAIEAVLDSDQPTPAEREALEALMPKLEAISTLEEGDREGKAEWEQRRQAEKEAGSPLRRAQIEDGDDDAG